MIGRKTITVAVLLLLATPWASAQAGGRYGVWVGGPYRGGYYGYYGHYGYWPYAGPGVIVVVPGTVYPAPPPGTVYVQPAPGTVYQVPATQQSPNQPPEPLPPPRPIPQ